LIRKPVSDSVRVGVNDTEYETEWSVDTTTGLLTFASAPASGALIKAGYQFDVPVRFDTDHLNLTALDNNLSKTEIPLIEVRV
ncbi:MAG TPA: TIGR02217 family protein, partial [Rhodospirillaceae bacterium]|nr:TIGR02217 family protein [Rhodospirillaceae bacterium]